MKTTYRTLGLGFALILSAADFAGAWLRPRFEDGVVVERAELIVVGRLEADSIQFIPHKKDEHEGRSHEHHANLVIREVLKGNIDSKKIPIIIHYGLTPRVGGMSVEHGFDPDHNVLPKNDPKAVINIHDTGGSAMGWHFEDAGKDNLWFLRKRSGVFGREPGTGKYGIVDPEDLQPLEWKDYFLAYLSNNPESSVKQYIAKHPDTAKRAQGYLDHLEIQRILKMEDPSLRFEKLLPFYANGTTWNMKSEAKQGIISCGDVAGKQLLLVFQNPQYKQLRTGIIMIWSDLKYKDAVPLLIDLLKQYNIFWEKQDLKEGWWNRDVESELTRNRREIYSETYSIVCALHSFADPRAKEAIEITKRRWESIPCDSSQIVEICDEALKVLNK